VRTDKRLERALTRMMNIRREIREYYFDYIVTAETLELRNIADAALLIIKSAMHRKESRGLHYTLDYPKMLPKAEDTVLRLDPTRDFVMQA
jgi:L-aspartate oxidase